MSEYANQLLAQLEALQADYISGGAPGAKPRRSFADLLRHWVSYDQNRIEPRDEVFLKESDRLVAALAEALAALAPAEREGIAAQAVTRLLVPPPLETSQNQEMYLLVAAYASDQLFPYLSRQELEQVRDKLLARTPRRMMFPKELALLKRAEALLKSEAPVDHPSPQ